MEKLKGRWDNDDHGIPCLVLYKNREKISDREVSKMLGHEQISTTQIYLDLTEQELEQAHRKYVV